MRLTTMTGADQLAARQNSLLPGGRFGLLTNPTGITRDFTSTIDVCAKISSAKLSALFACEHGIRGDRQAGVPFDDETDPELHIPVYSLYGKHPKPTPEMLEGLEAIIFDLQDLGIRFYTYLSTLIRVRDACAEHGKRLIVLDRPNPIGGIVSEGGLLRMEFASGVGAAPIPIRTGLTIGEFAKWINDRAERPCDLTVVPLQGWKREMQYPDTALPWVMPSPNMPTVDTARVYAGNCLFEGTILSEGRGTTKPFEMIGAPWLNAKKTCREMNTLGLPGIHFQEVHFTPVFSKCEGELCAGVQCHVTDTATYRPVLSALHLLHRIQSEHPQQFAWRSSRSPNARPFIDLLTGSDLVRTRLGEPGGLQSILRIWEEEAAAWERTRQPYLMYGTGEQ